MHEALLQRLWDEATILMLRLDRGGTIRAANPFAVDHLGDKLPGRPFLALPVAGHGPSPLPDPAVPDTTFRLVNLLDRRGNPVTYRLGLLPDVDGLLAIGSPDVDGLESLQRQVMDMNQELTELGRRLHKANAELKQLNALKTRFLGMAAHDLRKPVGAILAYADFLREEAGTALTAEQTGFLETILQTARRMGRLIDDFLDVACIEAGQLRLEREPIAPDAVIAGARPVLEVAARSKHVRLAFDARTGDCVMSADAAKLEQVLINLVGNAIEHTPSGRAVQVSVQARDGAIVFTVQERWHPDGPYRWVVRGVCPSRHAQDRRRT